MKLSKLVLPVILATLLLNPSFENGATNNVVPVVWYDEYGNKQETLFGNIFTPTDWHVWFAIVPCGDGWTAGQPEAGLISTYVDPVRVHTGDSAARMFTTWRCNFGGFWQQVAVVPGATYRASGFAHAWHSQCSSLPYSEPLDYDCVTPFNSDLYFRVGLDPYGGTDPRASTVVWSEAATQYGGYGPAVTTPLVEAQGVTMTVFLKQWTVLPLKHNDGHWDDVVVERVYSVWLPVVAR